MKKNVHQEKTRKKFALAMFQRWIFVGDLPIHSVHGYFETTWKKY